MEHLRQDEIEDLSLSPPAIGSMQIASGNGFGHNIEFMSQAYLKNKIFEINIEVEDDTSIADKDQPLPILFKFANVEYKVKISQDSFNNLVKAVYQRPFSGGKTTLLKLLGGRFHENVKGTVTYNDIPYNIAINRRLPRKMSRRQMYERAEVFIKELGLGKLSGGLIKGITRGEIKRTSIGYESLVDPSLLSLDEPTSVP
ncbi:unnamed protein product [Withania somnifera]